MSRLMRVAAFLLGIAVLAPAVAYAQASIAGVVRDPSGGVLPGVTVGDGALIGAGRSEGLARDRLGFSSTSRDALRQ